MINTRTLLLTGAICFGLSLTPVWVNAEQPHNADVGVDVSLRYQSQKYSERDASLWSTTVSPYVLYENWIVGMDIAYQRVNGVFNFRGTPQQERNCALLAAGAVLPERLEPYRDRLLTRCQEFTDENNSEEGVGDVNFYGSYGKWLGDSAWHMVATIGYAGDNADADHQLGSGTRDIYADIVLTQDYQRHSVMFLAGYNYLLGGAYKDFYENYGYLGAELSSPRAQPWVFGIGLDYQQDDFEPISSARLFAQWRLQDSLLLKFQLKGYEDSTYYPSSSADASIAFSF